MTLSVKDLCIEVIKPSLESVKLYSPAVEQLMIGTAAKESRLIYLRQICGPALGLWQMEPATHQDIWDNYLPGKKKLWDYVKQTYGGFSNDKLIYDLRYACLMARIKYLRSPMSIPAFGDIEGQGMLWKQVYNTPKGKGTVDQYVSSYNSIVKPFYDIHR